MTIRQFLGLLGPVVLGLYPNPGAAYAKRPPGPVFEISFPAVVHQEQITGRIWLIVSRTNEPEPRFQVGLPTPPVFGLDVNKLKPGQAAVIDGGILGYPLRSLEEIPPGDYYVQALMNVYTEFHRADGHVLWAHMDQWEGQRPATSPGNLYSKVQRLHVERSQSYTVKLSLTNIIPPVRVPDDTEWVKRIKIQSNLLTNFWGRPIYLGAVVLLPRDYASRSNVRYPVIYAQGHFSLEAPLGFRTDNPPESVDGFSQAWRSDKTPRMIAVTFQHPTPYYDLSLAVNSASVGPYGDAIMTELIPYIEEHFRVIREPYARVLTGASGGGWESLALQLFHPEFFGGVWSFCPGPVVDFRRYYGELNIYEDENAFVYQPLRDPDDMVANLLFGYGWSVPLERYVIQTREGQPYATVRQLTQLDVVLGNRAPVANGAVESVFSPVGDDGYPKPLWDKTTGKLDHSVASYMREHGYDLRAYAQEHWPKIGPQLVGKLHFYVGDMDEFRLALAVYLMEDFLKNTKTPYYGGSFEYGRPMKGHGWSPMSGIELLKSMAEQISRNAPSGAPVAWKYD